MPMLMNISQSQPYLADQSQFEPFPNNDGNKKMLKNFFPHQLMEILSLPFFSDCAVWAYNEKSFFITDPEEFARKYDVFCKRKTASRKESFARKLNRWGFKMELNKGPLCGAYSHPLFNKNKPWLCEQMTCNKKRRLQHLHSNGLSPILGKDNTLQKRRKNSSSSTSLTNVKAAITAKMPDPVGSRFDATMMELLQAKRESAFAVPYYRDESSIVDQELLRKELQVQQMMTLFELNGRTRKSNFGDCMLESNDSYSRLHSTIVKNAMMALL